MPDCPEHLSDAARIEWHRLAETLSAIGVLTVIDRAALAAYCQAWGRWTEAEEKMRSMPVMLKAPSGYVQQNPWLSVANQQLEIMSRYMTELGLTPASRSRIVAYAEAEEERDVIQVRVIFRQPAAASAMARAMSSKDANRDEDGMYISTIDSRTC